ncbi:hypothetical protein [Streptomyces sp. NPDC005251]|uniref:hypothetical protein n=1 Tax=unclassified Streptomyces TaxID=2593676 RepID=UPI0033B93111
MYTLTINRLPVGEVLIGDKLVQAVTHPHGRRGPQDYSSAPSAPIIGPELEPIDIAATPPPARTNSAQTNADGNAANVLRHR